MSDDWLLIQRVFTDSKEFAKTILYAFVSMHSARRTGLRLTLLPNRVWKTGPYLLDHSCATLAWLDPSWSKFPNKGTPGISGRFLILGVSVRLR